MYSIVSCFKETTDFAFKVKAYLDDLIKINESGLSGEYTSNTYFFDYKTGEEAITVSTAFKDVYDYVIKKCGKNDSRLGQYVEEYIELLLQEAIMKEIN